MEGGGGIGLGRWRVGGGLQGNSSIKYGCVANISSSSFRLSENASPHGELSAAPSSPGGANARSTTSAPAKAPVQPPLQTYNVTKADAKPLPSTHHSLHFDGLFVSVPWEEGLTSRFHNFWLRDHCPCPSCKHPRTGQRILDTWRIGTDVKPKHVEAGELSGEAGLKVVWEDGHESFYGWRWLHLHSYNPRLEKYFSPQFRTWGGKELKEEGLPEVEYDKIMSDGDEGVKDWTGKLVSYLYSDQRTRILMRLDSTIGVSALSSTFHPRPEPPRSSSSALRPSGTPTTAASGTSHPTSPTATSPTPH